MYNEPALTETITIDGVESASMQFGMKTTLKCGKKKFIFYDKKKDGTETTASKQFRELGIGIGRTIGVGYSSTDKVYSKGGQDIPYQERRILYFETGEQRKTEPLTHGMEPVKDLFESRMKKLEDMIKEQGEDIDRINYELQSLINPKIDLDEEKIDISDVPF